MTPPIRRGCIAEQTPRLGDVEEGGVRILSKEFRAADFRQLAEPTFDEIERRLRCQRVRRADEEDLEAADLLECQTHRDGDIPRLDPAPEIAVPQLGAAGDLAVVVRKEDE